MFSAIRLSGGDRFAAKTEVLMFRIANRPAASLGRQVRQSKYPGFDLFRHRRFHILALDRRGSAFKPKAVSFAYDSVFRHTQTLSDLARGQPFRPQLLEAPDLFVVPAHCVSNDYRPAEKGLGISRPYSGNTGVSTHSPAAIAT